MEVYDKTFKEFKKKALDVLQKYPSSTALDYIEQCKLDLENFKKYGSFKNPQNETTQSGNVPFVKLERISENSPMMEIIPTAQVKVENMNTDMPPPTEPLKRNRRKQTQVKLEGARITRSKIKKEVVEPKRSIQNRKTEAETNRDSDIILQRQEIDTVSLSDTDDDLNNDVDSNRPERSQNNPSDNHVKEILPTHNTRSTRSKVKVKENSDKIEEISKPKPTRTKRVKSKDLSDSETSVYEDAITTENEKKSNRIVQINSTYVASPSVKRSKVNDQSVVLNKPVNNEVTSKKAANETVISEKVMNSTVVLDKLPINETVVIENPKVIMDKTVVLRKESPVLPAAQTNNCDDIMTEDESEEYSSPVKHKYKKNTNKNTKPKAIFSPFENSPVKKRVEAFEKLGAEVDCETQKKIKSKLNKKQLEVGEGHLTRSAKEKIKHVFTPILDRNKIKLGTSTVLSNNESTSILSTKSASALKALYQDHKERELQRKEKEAETQRKKEALLQAQIEERRRKREEKQLKAQQSREALGKEKQKTLEHSEKMKEVKYKQVLAEKQEKLAKQREEAEKKRILASKKALEEKRKEKERKNAIEEDYPNTRTPKRTEQKLCTKPTNKPKYLTMKAPLLPTEYCYDSDDERATSDLKKPGWAEWNNLCWTLTNMHFAGDKIKNTFFVCEATTPDLQDIFENIDPRKLKRTSSAIWLKPPRFTLMPTYFEKSDTDD